jgi:hypothetical protein
LETLPPAFDCSIYKTKNPAVARKDDLSATAHYYSVGERAGLVCNSIHGRGQFLKLVPPRGQILEIGPYIGPAFRRPQHNVLYLDVFSTDELKKKAVETGKNPDSIPEIDFVWSGEKYADIIKTKFQSIFSAHNIEHQPDLITHLRELTEILLPDGLIYLAVPDRRYCFDHFLPDTNFSEVFGAYIEKRKRHYASNVIEHRLLTTHNDTARHWKGDHGDRPLYQTTTPNFFSRLTSIVSHMNENPEAYFDTHAWQFTPSSFRSIIEIITDGAFAPLKIERIYPTIFNSNEFYAVLRRL